MNSHLPVLNLVCAAIAYPDMSVKTTFEFGCGDYSTAFFADHSREHYAVDVTGHEYESRSIEWFKKTALKYAEIDHVDVSLTDHAGTIKKMFDVRPDIVFVDGAINRPDCVNAAFKSTAKAIVCHDTEETGYAWEEVEAPHGWTQLTRGNLTIPDVNGAWTTVWTHIPWVAAVLTAAGLNPYLIPRNKNANLKYLNGGY